MANSDFFLKFDNYKGDSPDAAHPGEIEIESFSWGLTASHSIGSGGGAGSGKVKFETATFTARVSSASPQLALACASGHAFQTVVLTVRKAGGTPQDYYQVTFKLVAITNYRSIGGPGADIVPRDEITIEYGGYLLSHRTQQRDGTLGAANLNGWDRIQNTKL